MDWSLERRGDMNIPSNDEKREFGASFGQDFFAGLGLKYQGAQWELHWPFQNSAGESVHTTLTALLAQMSMPAIQVPLIEGVPPKSHVRIMTSRWENEQPRVDEQRFQFDSALNVDMRFRSEPPDDIHLVDGTPENRRVYDACLAQPRQGILEFDFELRVDRYFLRNLFEQQGTPRPDFDARFSFRERVGRDDGLPRGNLHAELEGTADYPPTAALLRTIAQYHHHGGVFPAESFDAVAEKIKHTLRPEGSKRTHVVLRYAPDIYGTALVYETFFSPEQAESYLGNRRAGYLLGEILAEKPGQLSTLEKAPAGEYLLVRAENCEVRSEEWEVRTSITPCRSVLELKTEMLKRPEKYWSIRDQYALRILEDNRHQRSP
ncbi:MAG: hypothetical protein Q7R76_02195 [Candidatus Woesearchaeota archaeon]|nr:hypothetical protein [Candidatus Woesearchaeota archaeon]